ncbi:MAG: hypothetical protein ACI8WB_000340 [Phenylobacterium sp.]|jgi:hypothetical protein
MNKHTKLAFLLAPLLLVGGYIASDLYLEHEADQQKIFNMAVQGECDIKAGLCVLQSGKFQLGFSDMDGITRINSTFPLDTATLFMVNGQGQATPHPLGMIQSPYYWQSKTKLGAAIAKPGASYKLRVIANIKGGSYIGEFVTTSR